MFSTQSDNKFAIFLASYLFAAEFEEPKIGMSGKGLGCLVFASNMRVFDKDKT